MRLTNRYLAVVTLALAAACAGPVASASADRSIAVRYQTHTRGDLAYAANTLLTCPVAVAACGPARSGTGGSRQNNNFNMEHVDVDGDAATFNSSRATLSLPAGATVTFAGLYWGADTSAGAGGVAAPTAALAPNALLDTPGAGGYQPVIGSQFDEASSAWPGRYQEFADVTARVAAAGAGDYTLANVQAGTGNDRYAGWTLVVAYHHAGDPVRSLSVLDGMVTVQNTSTYDLTIDGFETPGAGIANATLGLVTYEGDYGISGDGLSLNGTALSDPINGSTNFFNSSISDRGTRVTAKSPDYVDQLGFDADRVSADGLIPAGATSADLHLTTNGDTYFVGAVTLSADQVPEAPVNDAAPAVSGTARAGEVLTADDGDWSGTGPLDVDYQWQRCDGAGTNCVDIPGATGSTYTLTPGDIGNTVVVVVTATNDVGAGSATSAPSAPVAAPAQVTPPAGGPGDGGEASDGGRDTPADLALLPGSTIAPDSCQQVTGSQVLAFEVAGAGRFRIRVAPNGPITAANPLRAAAPLAGGSAGKLTRHVRRVVYRLGGRRIAVRRRAPWSLRIGPATLRRVERQTLAVRVVPKRGKPRVARVQLNSRPCSELFTVVHRPSPKASLLGLRVDSVKALNRIVFRVPVRLLAKRGSRGVAGKLRVRVAGRRSMNFRLSFARRKGRATTLLAGAGRPRVQISGGKITVTGLPAGTGGIRLRLRARGMRATPRARLRAEIQSGGSSRRLTQRLGTQTRVSARRVLRAG